MRFSPREKFKDYMKEMKSNNHTQKEKIICDWTDKKNNLIHYRIVNFFVRQGMIADKNLETIFLKQNRWLDKI